MINGFITVCGGNSSGECFGLSAERNEWAEFPGMGVVRVWADSAVTPSGWWVTGK